MNAPGYVISYIRISSDKDMGEVMVLIHSQRKCVIGGSDNRGFILIGQGKGKERIQARVGRVGCPNPNLISGGVGFKIKKNRSSKSTIGID